MLLFSPSPTKARSSSGSAYSRMLKSFPKPESLRSSSSSRSSSMSTPASSGSSEP
ncbi:unnamed protein product [Ixodes pacificus]